MGRSKKDKAKEADAEMDAQDTALDEAAEERREPIVTTTEHILTPEPTEDAADEDEASDAEKVELEAHRMRIRVNVNVNGHHEGDTLVVDRDHPFYSSILRQQLAEEIG